MKKILSILVTLLILVTVCGCSNHINWNKAEEVESTESSTTVRIDLLSEYAGEEKADSIKIDAVLLNGMDLPVKKISAEYEILSDEEGYYANCDLESYGRHQIAISYLKDGSVIGNQNIEYILTADEYNIALLSATVPVTYFSLFMADTDNAYAAELKLNMNSDLPTIIGLERAAAYNWESLLPNMKLCPFTGDSSYSGENLSKLDYTHLIDAFKQYIGYLHDLNPESIFHLYINDFDSYYIPYLMLENGIDFSQFDVYAISDGTGTPGAFRRKYGTGADPDESMSFYSHVERVWNSAKEKAINGLAYLDDLREISDYIPGIYRFMQDFMPVLVNDPELKIEWIMNRNNPDAFGTSQAYTEKVQNNEHVHVVNMYNILGALSDKEVKDFQAMYKFDSSIFEKADSEGKGIMIFLGTSTSGEVHFREYLMFMTHYYGDDYIYYYKAHPGYAADFDKSKADLLNELGIISLDASIPAELFYFFRTDAVMCGYQSSTFENAAGVGISCIVNTDSQTYNGRADLTITANEDGTFTVANMKDYPGTFTWDPAQPDVFPWLNE